MSDLNLTFLLGANTSGKDKQAELLVKDNPDGAILPTGEIFRSAQEPGSLHHEKVAPFIKDGEAGKLLPDDIVMDIVKEEIDNHLEEGKTHIVLPGFPRTEGQLDAVKKLVDEIDGEVTTDYVALVVTDDTVIARAKRRKEKALAANKEPRSDDEIHIVKDRLRIYHTHTKPMLRRLSSEEDERFHPINANGQTNDEVHQVIRKRLGMLDGNPSRKER